MEQRSFQWITYEKCLQARLIYKSVLFLSFCLASGYYAYLHASATGLILSFLSMALASTEISPNIGLRLRVIKECENIRLLINDLPESNDYSGMTKSLDTIITEVKNAT